jgi:hypothetical protein
MPVLGEKTLGKRFLCEFCQKTFRTRQGLHGHMQFKHLGGGFGKQPEASDTEKGEAFVLSAKVFQQRLELIGIKGEEQKELVDIWVNWLMVKAMFEDEKMKFDIRDRKTYLVTVIAQRQANKKLLDDLKKEFAAISGKSKN